MIDPPGAAPHPYNPYAPPRARGELPKRPPLARGRLLARLYAATLLGGALAYLALRLGDPRIHPLAVTAMTAAGNCRSLVGMAWLYFAWRAVPEMHRGTVTPRRAVLSFFIPFYNAYWTIAINTALCDTLDGILERSGSAVRAPRALGIVAGAAWLAMMVVATAIVVTRTQLGGYALIGPAVSGLLWLVYMQQCDRAHEAVVRVSERPGALDAPRLSQLQRERGPGLAAGVALWTLPILGIAIWQFLSPAAPSKPSAAGTHEVR